ncbi:MAG: ATP-dependent Clp protease ATP-binding subunit [Bacteroidales bacterium]|nr:ATP-dependent Clp protease ATP-binding subunit [Bacteroidales bacterium]
MDSHQEINRILRYAMEEALRTGWDVICLEHYLLAIIRDKNNEAYRFMEKISSTDEIKERLIKHIDKGFANTQTKTSDLSNNSDSNKIFGLLIEELSGSPEYKSPSAANLLGAILKEGDTETASILYDAGIDYDLAQENIKLPKDRKEPPTPSDDNFSNWPNSGEFEEDKEDEELSIEYIIENYGSDLTAEASKESSDPIIGREEEITRTIQILGRRKKNNPILIGEAGVGKTSIVEGIAQRIAQKKVPVHLLGKKIVSLDMGAIVAGTKFRGEFEARIKKILKTAKNNKDIIFFIDEIHTIVGAGSSSGSIDAADLLKPALTRGDFQCIGTTTHDEYRNVIEKNKALDRRLQKVIVEPCTIAQALEILNGIKSGYEDFHSVEYTPEAIRACINLSTRYISDRALPDKAIDILDEAGAKVSANNKKVPKEIASLEKEIALLEEKKKEAIRQSNFNTGAEFRKKELEKITQLDSIIEKFNSDRNNAKYIVTENDIFNVVANMTGIPVNKIATTEGNRLLAMPNILKEKIIGQDTAVDLVCRAIRRNRAGLKNPDKPIGTFLFLGPTGVGKTHLAKVLSEFMFDSADSLIRIDMSEYMEKFSVSRLIGAPPGYVGYNEGGQLSERVRKKPYSVVLLDEIEKAHPDIFNLLLQILDEGRLTDSSGRYIDFRNTILILTSNIGSKEISNFGNGLGFKSLNHTEKDSLHKNLIDKAINKNFAPEFINRLDEKIYFNSLTRKDLEKILDIEMKYLLQRVSEAGYHLRLTKGAVDFLLEKGFDPKFGARPLKRVIQKYVEDTLAEAIIGGVPSGSTITLKINHTKDNLSLNIK